MNSDLMFYGESVTEDECLCDKHGCRLGYHYLLGWLCPECEAEMLEEERMSWQEEANQLMAEAESQGFVDTAGGSCTMIQGDGFVGFQCIMPWYA